MATLRGYLLDDEMPSGGGGTPNLDLGWIDVTDAPYNATGDGVTDDTASASVNSPRLILKYHTAFTTTVATFQTIGASEVSSSLAAATLADSGWINLVAGSLADVFLTVTQIGGDATADPAVAQVLAHFR